MGCLGTKELTQMTQIVSVIMPVFNGENFLNYSIESVLRQTYKKLELIIVNDGSVDATSEILTKYQDQDPRIKVINLEHTSGGPARPRNVGLKFCFGDYIAFIDHDDIWHDKKIEIQMEKIKYFNIPFISCEKINFKENISFQENKDLLNINKFSKVTFHQLLSNNSIINSSVLVDKSIICRHQFREDSRFIAVEDYIMWCELHKQFPYSIKLSIPLVGYRISDSSISKNKVKMIFKRWNALKVITGPNILLRFKYLILYIITYFKKSYI